LKLVVTEVEKGRQAISELERLRNFQQLVNEEDGIQPKTGSSPYGWSLRYLPTAIDQRLVCSYNPRSVIHIEHRI
jgi:hypothetical protein